MEIGLNWVRFNFLKKSKLEKIWASVRGLLNAIFVSP